ncbi:MAG: hypothetical protein JXR69_04960 [Candidatus Delongbacteria bacterium]|nr:hypothetical protein [Candidatus Delongbacteria bacterium]
MTLIAKIKEAIEPIIIKYGQELVELSFDEKSRDKKLNVVVGSLKGPGITELTAITKEFHKLNDAQLIIPFDFSLDVSSPGLDRPLATSSDFKRNIGRDITVSYEDENGSVVKETGIVKEVLENHIMIETGSDKEKKIDLDKIIKSKLIIKIGKRK